MYNILRTFTCKCEYRYPSLGVSLSPAGHAAPLCDGVTPQVEAHTDDGAGQEDGEDHQGADQQVEKGVEDGAAGGGGTETCGRA